jgi:hypothetical protein
MNSTLICVLRMFSFSYVEMRIVALFIIHLCLDSKILDRIVVLSIIHLCHKGLRKHAKEHEEKRRKRKKEIAHTFN